MFSIQSSPFNSLGDQIYAGACCCDTSDEFDDDFSDPLYVGGWTRGSAKKATIKNRVYDALYGQLVTGKWGKKNKRAYNKYIRSLKNPSLKMLMSTFSIPKRKLKKMKAADKKLLWDLFTGIRFPQARFFKKPIRPSRPPTYTKTYKMNGIVYPGVRPAKKRKPRKKKKNSLPYPPAPSPGF